MLLNLAQSGPNSTELPWAGTALLVFELLQILKHGNPKTAIITLKHLLAILRGPVAILRTEQLDLNVNDLIPQTTRSCVCCGSVGVG